MARRRTETRGRSANARRGMWPIVLVGLALGCGADSADLMPAGNPPQRRPLFVEVTKAAGLPDAVDPWPDGHFFTPELGSGGLALLDYDNDGDLDLYCLCHSLPDEYPQNLKNPGPNRFYEQQPDGTFRDVTERTGLGDPGFGMGVAVGDVDNDGHLDIYVCNYGVDQFYRNNGDGSFTEATEASGLAFDHPWSTSAGFFDFDRDGDLDLYVCRFGHYDPMRVCRQPTGERDYCGPAKFDGLCDTLYRNDGNGRFTDVSEPAGINVPLRAWGLLFADFNGDDWPDIYVTNDEDTNALWINQKDGTFVDEGFVRGVAVNGAGRREGSMGVTAGDVDGDGGFDLLMTHINYETNTLYTSSADGAYRDGSARSKLGAASLPMTGWGCAFFDFDHDTDLDLAIAQGRIMIQPVLAGARLGPFWNRYAEPNVLFENDGRGRFTDTHARAGSFAQHVEISYSLAVGDLDNDGDLDMVVRNHDNGVRIFRNDAPPNGRHWLTVRPMVGLRDAYGATVTIGAGNRRLTRIAHPTYSYAASNDPRAHFGLGESNQIDSIEILWPDGRRERFEPPPVDQIIVLRQGEGN